jgi:hypothetical protein
MFHIYTATYFILCHDIDLLASIKEGTWFKDVRIQGVWIQGAEQNIWILEEVINNELNW